MKKKFYVGAHSSIGLGYLNSLKAIDFIGGNSVQIFLKNPRGRYSKELNEKDARNTKNYLKENSIFLVGHSSYLLNFAKYPLEQMWAVESLLDDLNRISKLGGYGVVTHIGKSLKLDKEVVLKNIYDSLKIVILRMPKNVKIILENTAGQGTEVGYQFEELKEIYDLFNENEKKQIEFCIDTCHSHVAGYDLSNKEGVKFWINEFDKLIGINKISCIHLNDAKKESGSRVDRHADLNFGTIGEKGLIEIVKFAKENHIPLILETPSENLSYEEQINYVKKFN